MILCSTLKNSKEVDFMPRAYTENRKKNNQKWDSENLDRVSIAMPKGKRDIIKKAAASINESMNQFINTAIDERMKKQSCDPTDNNQSPESPQTSEATQQERR